MQTTINYTDMIISSLLVTLTSIDVMSTYGIGPVFFLNRATHGPCSMFVIDTINNVGVIHRVDWKANKTDEPI